MDLLLNLGNSGGSPKTSYRVDRFIQVAMLKNVSSAEFQLCLIDIPVCSEACSSLHWQVDVVLELKMQNVHVIGTGLTIHEHFACVLTSDSFSQNQAHIILAKLRLKLS